MSLIQFEKSKVIMPFGTSISFMNVPSALRIATESGMTMSSRVLSHTASHLRLGCRRRLATYSQAFLRTGAYNRSADGVEVHQLCV